MKKEEILQKTKRAGPDGREQQIEFKAMNYGSVAATVFIALFSAISAIIGQVRPELAAILCAFLTAQFFYKYRHLKRRVFLVTGCIAALGLAAGIVSYIVLAVQL